MNAKEIVKSMLFPVMLLGMFSVMGYSIYYMLSETHHSVLVDGVFWFIGLLTILLALSASLFGFICLTIITVSYVCSVDLD